eukprot:scaffold569_cov165-Amphora_coffeaeformis.AAC.16
MISFVNQSQNPSRPTLRIVRTKSCKFRQCRTQGLDIRHGLGTWGIDKLMQGIVKSFFLVHVCGGSRGGIAAAARCACCVDTVLDGSKNVVNGQTWRKVFAFVLDPSSVVIRDARDETRENERRGARGSKRGSDQI